MLQTLQKIDEIMVGIRVSGVSYTSKFDASRVGICDLLVLGFAIALGLKIGSGPARVWLFRKIPFRIETLKILTRKFLIKECTVYIFLREGLG